MADKMTDESPVEISRSFRNIGDFFEAFRNADIVRDRIESVTWNSKSQTFVIQMQELLRKESDQVERRHSEVDESIAQLSEKYKAEYPVLLERFQRWKTARENLIELLRSSCNSLDRNCVLVSVIRVVTSAVDILGTVVRVRGLSDSFWAAFAMEHVSTFGLLSHYLEMTLSKKMLRDVKKAIREDMVRFKEITEMFEGTGDLDDAVQHLFPYGIDKKLTKKIAKTSSDFTDYNKIFMSVVGSNVSKDIELFKDRKFLEDADLFSESEAGKQWFYKIILGTDPTYSHDLNRSLAGEIKEILNYSPGKNPEFYAEGCRVLTSLAKVKIALNIMTITSAGVNLASGYRPEESDVLKELLRATQKELTEIEKVVDKLKPPTSN